MSKNARNGLIIGLIIVIILVIAFVSMRDRSTVRYTTTQEQASEVTDAASQAPATTTSATGTSAGPFTMADVAAHNSASSCYSVINGSVYDLTNWIGKHPGGKQAILMLCGKDGSAAFNNQHGGMEQQAKVLATFKIGTLAH